MAVWLSQHATVEVVSRDRARSFADAIRRGAPKAVQVADRWHLLHNLFEVLARSLERHRPAIRAVGEAMRSSSVTTVPLEKSMRAAERTQEKRERRLQLYEKVATLIRNGASQSESSRRLGVSLRTVQRWMICGVFPERKRRIFPSSVDAFSPHLSKRVSEGCTNMSQLWREIRQQGFDGQLSTVRNWIRQHFAYSQNTQGSTMSKRTHPVSQH